MLLQTFSAGHCKAVIQYNQIGRTTTTSSKCYQCMHYQIAWEKLLTLNVLNINKISSHAVGLFLGSFLGAC